MAKHSIIKAALAACFLLALTPQANGQLLDPVGGVLGTVGEIGRDTMDTVRGSVSEIDRQAQNLADDRLSRLRRMARRHRNAIEMSDDGPAVRGQIVAIDPRPETLTRARAAGYTIIADEEIADIDIHYVTLGLPAGTSVTEAERELTRIDPEGEFAPNHLHFTSGGSARAVVLVQSALAGADSRISSPAIGVIDGGVADHPVFEGGVEQRGFARGAPIASAHATAVASLAVGRGRMRSGAPGVPLLVADIYGRDPAGGSATALARAIGWMAARRVPVVTISLVGPSNPLVERAVRQAQARGMQIVAPVGNDGPAAPAAYPASYRGVIAVTGVDRRNRPLVEAGRSLHLDYAAPAADMAAATPSGGYSRIRGTSFAVPLVAGRLTALGSRSRLDAEAVDLGPSGTDDQFGRGLVCGDCRTALR